MTHRLPVLLTLREKKNLEEMAAYYGETMSGVIKRLIIEEYMRFTASKEFEFQNSIDDQN